MGDIDMVKVEEKKNLVFWSSMKQPTNSLQQVNPLVKNN